MRNEPVWNSDTINKKKGDTTFEQCGWCNHGGSGSYRYNCMIEGNCNLLKRYNNEVNYNTQCKIITMGKIDIASVIESKEYEIKNYEQRIKNLKIQIYTLKETKVDDCPPIVNNRKYNHFNIDDKIRVFKNGVWEIATIINGYRHHDGCISYYADNKFHDGDYLDGHGGSGGISRPEFLLESEYQWFKSNPERFKEWIEENCKKKYNGDYLDPCLFTLP